MKPIEPAAPAGSAIRAAVRRTRRLRSSLVDRIGARLFFMHNTVRRTKLDLRILPKKKDPAAVKLGRKGGKQIAKRGPEYFRQLQARRKKREGGRPPKSKNSR